MCYNYIKYTIDRVNGYIKFIAFLYNAQQVLEVNQIWDALFIIFFYHCNLVQHTNLNNLRMQMI